MLVLLTTSIAVCALLYAGAQRRHVSPRTSEAATFWALFDIQLEAARRHERPLTLIRIADDTHIDVAGRAPMWTPDSRRMTDHVLSLPGETYVLAPDTGREAADVLAGRLMASAPESMTLRMACFPEDAITRHSMVAQLTRSTSQGDDAAPALWQRQIAFRRAS